MIFIYKCSQMYLDHKFLFLLQEATIIHSSVSLSTCVVSPDVSLSDPVNADIHVHLITQNYLQTLNQPVFCMDCG